MRNERGTRARALMVFLVMGVVCGCGVGVGQMVVGGSIGKNDDNTFDNTSSEHTSDTSVGPLRANSVTLYDSTGILLAALGTAGNAYNAQQQAESDAIRRGARAGDTYSYSYEVIPPAAGTKTWLTYAWGSGSDASITRGGQRFTLRDAEVDYFIFDIRSTLHTWDLADRMQLGIFLGVLWEQFEVRGTFDVTNSMTGMTESAGHEVDEPWIGMPVGLTWSYDVLEFVALSARLALDPVLSGIVALLMPNWFWMEAGARIDIRPAEWLLFYVDAAHRVTPWGIGQRSGSATDAAAGVAFIWEL